MDNPQGPVDNSAGTPTNPAAYSGSSTQPETPSPLDDMSKRKKSSSFHIPLLRTISPRILIVLLILIVALVGTALYLNKQKGTSPEQDAAARAEQNKKAAIILKSIQSIDTNTPIATVGSETIYQKDFQSQMAYSGDLPVDDNFKKTIMDRLVQDSIVLQEGAKEGLILLDASIYNTLNKDYKKRVKAVADTQGKVIKKNYTVAGSIVAIWFLNEHVPAMGYAKAKEITLEKITKIHADVKAGKLTMIQAGDIIKNDSSLAAIDSSYKINAYYNFRIAPNDILTNDGKFNRMVENLKPGEVTELYTFKSRNLDLQGAKKGGMQDAYFGFAQLTSKPGFEPKTFEEWIKIKLASTKVTYAH